MDLFQRANPCHLSRIGIIMTVALAVAFVTPPVCANIFVAQTMTGLSMDRIVKAAIPFVGALCVALLLIMFSPWMSEWPVGALR